MQVHQIDSEWAIHGDPTEAAIIQFMIEKGLYDPQNQPERLAELHLTLDEKK